MFHVIYLHINPKKTGALRIMGRMSREKGKRGEREACKALSDALGGLYRRSVQYCGRGGDADIEGLSGLSIEVKRAERFNLYSALEQALQDKLPGESPIVLHRRNGKPWVMVCYVQDMKEVSDAILKERDRTGD
jgi:hypothetical protein